MKSDYFLIRRIVGCCGAEIKNFPDAHRSIGKLHGGDTLGLSKRGFSLIELLIALAIFTFVIAAAYSTYIAFFSAATKEAASTAAYRDVDTTLKLLERDIQIAGFGLPTATMVASGGTTLTAAGASTDFQCNVGDETFCKNNTDRLFVADGAQILRDFTTNQADDGTIQTAPAAPDYLSNLTNAKNNSTIYLGYQALLTAAVAHGATSLTVSTLDLTNAANSNALFGVGKNYVGFTDPGADIISNQAIIISDGQTNVEGHRIGNANGTGISFFAHEAIKNTAGYPASTAILPVSVVPAIAWYVRLDPNNAKYPDGTPVYWLYRNQNRVIPYVDNFQVWYGYDAEPNDPVLGGVLNCAAGENDTSCVNNIWQLATIPSTQARIGDWYRYMPIPSQVTGPDNQPSCAVNAGACFNLIPPAFSQGRNWLRAVRVILTIKSVDKVNVKQTTTQTFMSTFALRNR